MIDADHWVHVVALLFGMALFVAGGLGFILGMAWLAFWFGVVMDHDRPGG